MSFRTKRVFIATPFYMLFEFFLLKYFFLLFGGVKDVYLFIATLLLGGLQCIPMIFEEKTAHCIYRGSASICIASTQDGDENTYYA